MTEKAALLTTQPVGVSGGQGPVLDQLTLQKLGNVEEFGLWQGNAFGEIISCGCCANKYLITDKTRTIQVQGRDDMVQTPLWLVQEESSACKRCMCCGQHPMMAKFYHAQMPQAGETRCGCYQGHRYLPDRDAPTVMTLERDGCCNKWIGCCICGPRCQSEAWLHAGDVQGEPGTIGESGGSFLGRSQVPRDGPCFKPTLNIFQSKKSMPPGYAEKAGATIDGQSTSEEHFGRMEGPCFFGGCLDLFTDTIFNIFRPAGQLMGAVIKQKPEGCKDWCMQCCTDIDNYNLDMSDKSVTPEQKANLLGSMVHLDYWFFQRDVRPVQVRSSGDGKSGVIIITLCNMYMNGCVVPCQICIPYGSK